MRKRGVIVVLRPRKAGPVHPSVVQLAVVPWLRGGGTAAVAIGEVVVHSTQPGRMGPNHTELGDHRVPRAACPAWWKDFVVAEDVTSDCKQKNSIKQATRTAQYEKTKTVRRVWGGKVARKTRDKWLQNTR